MSCIRCSDKINLTLKYLRAPYTYSLLITIHGKVATLIKKVSFCFVSQIFTHFLKSQIRSLSRKTHFHFPFQRDGNSMQEFVLLSFSHFANVGVDLDIFTLKRFSFYN
jgi:hypothetical protein